MILLLFAVTLIASATAQRAVSTFSIGGSAEVKVTFTQDAGNISVTWDSDSVSSITVQGLPVDYGLGRGVDRCTGDLIGPFGITIMNDSILAQMNIFEHLLMGSVVAIDAGNNILGCGPIVPDSMGPRLRIFRADFVYPWNGRVYLFQNVSMESRILLLTDRLSSNMGSLGTNIAAANFQIHGQIGQDEYYPGNCSAIRESDDPMSKAENQMIPAVITTNPNRFRTTIDASENFNLVNRGISLLNAANIVACSRIQPVFAFEAVFNSVPSLIQSIPFLPAMVAGMTGTPALLDQVVLDQVGGPSRECNDTTNVLVNLAATGNRPNSARQLEKVTLHGLGSIIGHATYTNDSCSWVVPGTMQPTLRRMGLVTFDGVILTGTILFRQFVDGNGNYGPTFISVDIGYTGAARGGGHNWHVHLNPRGEGEACEPNTIGGHYNPYNQSVVNSTSAYKLQCGTFDGVNTRSQYRCEMGDLSGKHGQLNIGAYDSPTRPTYVFHDSTLRLDGVDTILGRSVVIHDPDDGSYLTCATIEDTSPTDPPPPDGALSMVHISSLLLILLVAAAIGGFM